MKKNSLTHKLSIILDRKKLNFYYFLIIFIISSFIELIGLGLIIPFIIMVINKTNTIQNLEFFNFNINIEQSFLVQIILIFLLVKYIFMLYINYSIPKFAYDHQKELRLRIIKNFLYNNLNLNSNELVQLTTGTLQIFSAQFIISILKAISSALILFFITIYLVFFNPQITFFLILLFLIIYLFYNYYFKSRFKSFGKQIINSSENLILNTSQFFNGIQEIKIYNKQKFFNKKIKNDSLNLSQAETNTRFLITMPRFLMETIILFSIFLIALLNPVSISNEKSMLSLGVFGFAAIRIIPSLNDFITSLNNIKFSSKTIDTIFYSLKNEIYNDNKKEIAKIRFENLAIKNLDFKYYKSRSKIISRLSINIHKGDSVGIVGPSGSGKSTLVKIILGFLNPSKGKIIFNNKYKSLKNIFSYIPQDIFIIRGSIRENITLDDAKNKKIDKKVWASLRRSGLDKLIVTKKEKLNFYINDEGQNLSGGQKQRLAIARAIFHEKDLIILDEATSGLDLKKENQILNELFKNKNLTKIIISHKNNIREYCDKIIEFKKEKTK